MLKQYNIDYYMVSVDTLEDNTKFAKMHEADYPILANPAKDVANAYGVIGASGFASRWTFYIDPDGKILYIEKKVAPATAGPDMVAKLAELKIAKK